MILCIKLIDLYHSCDFIWLFNIDTIFSILKFHNVVVYNEFVLNGAIEERARILPHFHTEHTHPLTLKFPGIFADELVLGGFNYLGFLY